MSSKRLKLASIYFGNLFEHYDTALYSFLSPFFATIFFPGKDDLTALLLTFGIIPLGMIARPFGSLVFGHIGDVHGRGRALFFSLAGMAVVTAFIGIMPTSHQAKRLAPLLLLFTRILQNFFAAGENIGGAVSFLESHNGDKEKDFASSIYNTSSVIGILLASLMVAMLYHFDYLENGWRWLYLGGSSTAFCALLMRLVNDEASAPLQPAPYFSHFFSRLKSLWEMRFIVLVIAVSAGFSYASYSIAFSLMNGFVPLISNITKSQITKVNTALLVFDILLLPFFGKVAGRCNRSRLMMLASLTAIVTGVPLFYFLDQSTLPIVIVVRMGIVAIGVGFSATFHSWAQSLVPPEYRYTVVSFAYSLGSQLLGGTAAAASLWAYQQTSLVVCASFYWILLAAATFALLYIARVRRAT